MHLHLSDELNMQRFEGYAFFTSASSSIFSGNMNRSSLTEALIFYLFKYPDQFIFGTRQVSFNIQWQFSDY